MAEILHITTFTTTTLEIRVTIVLQGVLDALITMVAVLWTIIYQLLTDSHQVERFL